MSPPLATTSHLGGCLAFAEDGTIFLAIGDNTLNWTVSQDPFDLRGSLLHINRDGTPAQDNPYLDGTSGDPRTWAIGLRNPYRCDMQPETDNLFITDVGGSLWEELDIGVVGANYGWAHVEGPEPPGVPGFTYPIYSYFHDNPAGNAIISGDHVKQGDFREDWEENYFFADYAAGELWRMVLDENNNPVSTELFASGLVVPADFEFGPDGALYWASLNGGLSNEVRRIEYVGGDNSQPTAATQANPDNGPAPLNVTLDGSASDDPDGDPLTYSWDNGDGQSGTGASVVNHTYAQGAYEARLTVDDGDLQAQSILRIVSGNNRPVGTINSPSHASTFIAGQQISYAATGTDPEEGTIPCSQFSWQVVFHHAGHTHPFLGPEQGQCSSSFTTDERGETAADIWYRIRLEVEDTGVPIGQERTLSGEHFVEIYPETSLMTFETNPLPDLMLTLDTAPFTAPAIIEGVVNFIRRIGALDDQVRDGHTYRWLSWSDGGPRDHEIRTPASDTTYTATFGCDVTEEVSDLTVRKQGGGQIKLNWSPVTDPCFNTPPERYRVYASQTAVPAVAPGDFPSDPAFILIATTQNPALTVTPAPEQQFFVVVAVGTDLLDGAVGHYGD